MRELSDIDRRTYVRGLFGATVLAGGASAATGSTASVRPAADDEHDDDDDRDERDPAHPAARPILWDASPPMGFEVHNHYNGDPAFPDEEETPREEHDDYPDPNEPRDRVVHVSTDEMETSDYAAGLVNVQKRTDRHVTLADVQDGSLTYDYFRGTDHTGSTPDEVFLVVQTPEQADDDEGVALFKHIADGEGSTDDEDSPHDADGDDAGEWRTVDVVDEMASGNWRAIEIDEDPENMRLADETVGQAVERTAASLRDEEETLDDIVAEYGDDTELVGVGYGAGNTQTEIVLDVYYDNLHVEFPEDDDSPGEGPPDDTPGEGPPDDSPGEGPPDDSPGEGPSDDEMEFRFDFPAVLPATAEFDETTADLELSGDEVGIDLDDLRADTVTLYAYSEAAPPLEEGVTADEGDVDVTDDGFTATFDADEIRNLDRLGTGEQFVLVAGEFDYDPVVWFLAEGTVEVEE